MQFLSLTLMLTMQDQWLTGGLPLDIAPFMGGNLVTEAVAWYSAEAEFRAMAKGICKLLWLENIL